MKAKQAFIAWTPMSFTKNPTRGQIRVVHERDRRMVADLRFSSGACNREWREARGERPKVNLLSLFIAIVVRDGINPKAAHKEFCQVEEYVAHVSDGEGVDD